MFRILWFEFHDWNVLCQSFVSFWIFFKYDSFWNIFFTNNCICLNIRFHDSDSSRTLPSSYWLAPAFLSTKEKEELFIHFKFNRLIQNYSTDLRFVFKSNVHRLLHRLLQNYSTNLRLVFKSNFHRLIWSWLSYSIQDSSTDPP